MTKILGIDLGTAITKYASIVNGEPKAVENREGSILTLICRPDKRGKKVVGVLAQRQAITNPKALFPPLKDS